MQIIFLADEKEINKKAKGEKARDCFYKAKWEIWEDVAHASRLDASVFPEDDWIVFVTFSIVIFFLFF